MKLLSPFAFFGHPDSGCTGTTTPSADVLINARPCSEKFRTATGTLATATCKGDMPVLVQVDGRAALLVLRNVRCVPAFKFTLLSVRQMWREQRIRTRFEDEDALLLPKDLGGGRVRMCSELELPSIRMISAAKLARVKPPLVALATPASTPRAPAAATPASAPPARTPSSVPGGVDAGSSSPPLTPPSAPSPPVLPTPRVEAPPAPAPTVVAPTREAEPSGEAGASKGERVPSFSSRPLGWRHVSSVSHIAKLPASQAAELLHRRSHLSVAKLRALAHTTRDAPKVLASAPAVPACDGCAQARITKASHPGTLDAPAPEPGTLHFDIKEMIVSLRGFRYIVFLIDEHTRKVFYDFVKNKSEAMAAVDRCIAAFDATVGTPVDADGRPLPRPKVRALHSDREGKLMSHAFRDFRADSSLHHTVSPSHDHDLNPIPERIIGVISDQAAAIRISANASPRLWPWIIAYAVDWHNAAITAVGSSSADANISPDQRFTLVPPRVMDLATFGCVATVLRPPTHIHKPSLSGRGWIGGFLGRSRESKGSYDVLVDGKVVPSSSVLVDEERMAWGPPETRNRPLLSCRTAPEPVALQPLLPASAAGTGSDVSAPATYDGQRRLCLLNLFSGPYARVDGLKAMLEKRGWAIVREIDNDGESGGGWGHDLLNDKLFAELLAAAKAGEFDAIMIAFPCSTFAITRFFDATDSEGGVQDRGPPVIRKLGHADGLPENEVDPKHRRELKLSNLLLDRVAELAIAARKSPARTTIVVENPADRSPGASIASAPEFKEHASLFQTSAFKRMVAEADLTSHATFAYCMLGSEYQKYTSIYYTPEAGGVLDALNDPAFKCNHERGSHAKRAGGRGTDGRFVSAAAAAYPARLNEILALAFTFARTGGASVVSPPLRGTQPQPVAAAPPAARPLDSSSLEAAPDAPTVAPVPRPQPPASPSHSHGGASPDPSTASPVRPAASPISFPDLPSAPSRDSVRDLVHSFEQQRGEQRSPTQQLRQQLPAAPPAKPRSRNTGFSEGTYWMRPAESSTTDPTGRPLRSTATRQARVPPAQGLAPVPEEASAGPIDAQAAAAMRAAAAETAFDAHAAAAYGDAAGKELLPISDWVDVPSPSITRFGKRVPGGARTCSVEVALSPDGSPPSAALVSSIGEALAAPSLHQPRGKPSTHEEATDYAMASMAHALRADSPDAPSTHAEAMKRGTLWIQAEAKELDNHKRNESWRVITRDELPAGRRVHKLIWVYKTKRDGTAKARLCVQGNTLEAGIDYDQVFSAALRYSSARALFAYAARNGCKVRSIDLVAAYLQGRFVEGEVVYTWLPQGYGETDSRGRPKLARVMKPIYGIQQSGRRLQRDLFDWLTSYGFKPLDDSDPCIFTLECPDGEVLTMGVYVDNLQLVHSVALGADGRGPEGCAYNKFIDALTARWDVTDEGPMEDLLGIEVDYNGDGSITLHQRRYIEKLVSRFLTKEQANKAQSKTAVPYSEDFLSHVNESLSQTEAEYPELVKEMQSRVGCLMYAATSTRPDVAYAVHQLCKCLHKPTPELLRETDYIIAYLGATASLGLTYTREQTRLLGYADASWETAHSTSGWLVMWGSAALTWGSRKQKCIALSTCEAEIIALSEAAKDVVYLRKLVKGLGAEEPSPTSLRTDSKSARDVSYNPEHHDRMKHVQRRHFFVRDMVESFELEVPFVPTAENVADLFTKPMKDKKQFMKLRAIAMNLPRD